MQQKVKSGHTDTKKERQERAHNRNWIKKGKVLLEVHEQPRLGRRSVFYNDPDTGELLIGAGIVTLIIKSGILIDTWYILVERKK